jgi:hypothetical protein
MKEASRARKQHQNRSDCSACRRGETNAQRFYVLSLCLVGFLLLVVVYHVFLCISGVFRCCYIYCMD